MRLTFPAATLLLLSALGAVSVAVAQQTLAQDAAQQPAQNAAQDATAQKGAQQAEKEPAPPPVAPPPETVPLADRLKELYDRDQDAEAVRLGEEHLKRSPADVAVRLAVARSLAREASRASAGASRELLTQAYNHLLGARSTDSSRIDVRIAMCDVLYHLKRHDVLLEEVRSLLQAHPGDEKAASEITFYARQYLKENQPARAADIFGLLAAAAPDSAAVVADQGTTLLLAGDLDGGLAALERAARLDSTDADTAHNVAQALLYRGDVATALEWFEKAVKASPATGRFVLDLAVVQAIATPERAQPLFEKASEILGGSSLQKILVENLRLGMTSPNIGSEGLQELAKDLLDAGYPIYALAVTEKLLRTDPGVLEIVLMRADICDQKRFFRRSLAEYRRAGSLLQKAASKDKGKYERWILAGEARALTGLGQPREALDLLKQAGPAESLAFENADAMISLGDIAGARALLEKAAARLSDPDYAEAARHKLKELTVSLP